MHKGSATVRSKCGRWFHGVRVSEGQGRMLSSRFVPVLLRTDRIVNGRAVLGAAVLGAAVLGAAGVLSVGCSSKQPSPPSEEAILSRAEAQLENPGAPVFSVPSSLPGVSTWTAYVGPGVNILGRDASGQLQVAIALETDDQAYAFTGSACSVMADLKTDCATTQQVAARDIQGAQPAATAATSSGALHALDNPILCGGMPCNPITCGGELAKIFAGCNGVPFSCADDQGVTAT